MPQAGVNQDPLEERLIFGHDGTNYRVIKVDTDGNLVAAVLADQVIQSQAYGYFDADWRKAPPAFGVSDTFIDNWSNTNIGGGNTTHYGAACPADTIRVCTTFTIMYVGTVPVYLTWLLYDGSSTTYLDSLRPITSGVMYARQGWWVLKAGVKLGILIGGGTAGDNIYGYTSGFDVDVS